MTVDLRSDVTEQRRQGPGALQQALSLAEIYQAQAGLLADSDAVADALPLLERAQLRRPDAVDTARRVPLDRVPARLREPARVA